MDTPSLIIWLMALALGAYSLVQPGRLYVQALKKTLSYVCTMFPRIFLALLVSGFLSAIIPTELVATWLGKETGLQGILIGSLVGGFTPGGPMICFPIVFILVNNGAAIPPLVAFLTAWSVFGFHRILAFEIPLVGMRFATIRLVSALVLPPLAGLLSTFVETTLFMGI